MPLNRKLIAVSLACALGIIGCDNKKESKEAPQAPKEETVATGVVENTPKCDDASVKNGLVRALATQINDQINGAVSNFDDIDSAELARRTQQRLSDLGIDLQNAQADGNTCHIDVLVNLPINDTSYANRHFAKTDSPSIAMRASELNITLDSNNRLTIPVSYQLIDGVVTLNQSATPALSMIADVMSASAYVMAKGGGKIDTSARPTISVRPLTPATITPANPQPTQNSANNAAGNRTSTSSSNTATNSDNASTSTNTTARETPAQDAPERDSRDPLVQEFREQNAGNDDSSRDSTPKPKAEPKSEAPKAEPKAAAPTGNDEITIVETDETY